jgi:hypothetical protein
MRITITRPTVGGGRYTAEELRDPLFADVRLEGAPEEVSLAGARMPLTLHYREVSSGVLDVLVQCPPAVLAQWARFYRQHTLQGGEWMPLPGQECDCHQDAGRMRQRCSRVQQKDQGVPE